MGKDSKVKLLEIPLDQIRPNTVASLRPVHTDSEDFQALVDSIKQQGILASITVRPAVDPETQEKYYELIDGLQRSTAAKEAGLKTIPATIREGMTNSDVLEAQLIANVHKIETKPAEYSKQLERILTENTMMTEAELAQKLAKSTQWLRDRLKLNVINNPEILKLINNSKICLNNAYALAKLPEEERGEWVSRAMETSPVTFVPEVQKRVKEIKDAIRKGKDAAPTEFSPVPHCQKVSVLKEEFADSKIGPTLIKAVGAKTAEEGFRLGVAWVLHMDPSSQEEARAQHEQKQREAADKLKKLTQERAVKKAKKAAEAAAKAQADAKLAADAAKV